MICPNCQTEITEGKRFCGRCGATLGAVAPKRSRKTTLATGLILAILIALGTGWYAWSHLGAGARIWEGDVVAPRFTTHEKFFLIRKGSKITGYYMHAPGDPSALGNLDEVEGTSGPDNSFRILSEGGFIWKGKFLSSEAIEGTKPNGPDGTSPEFPFSLHVVRDAAPADEPPALPPTNSDWDMFLAKFKSAVEQRNQDVLKAMIGRTFYLQNSRIRTVDDIFRQLNWLQLNKALETGSVKPGKSILGRKTQAIIDNRPCPICSYAVSVFFRQDNDEQWRWAGMGALGD